MKTRSHYKRAALFTIVAAGLACGSAFAQVDGVIIKDNGQQIRGNLEVERRRQRSTRIPSRAAPCVQPIPLGRSIPFGSRRRRRWRAAVEAVQGGATSGGAIAALEKIADDYLMLEHDIAAARLAGRSLSESGPSGERPTCFRRSWPTANASSWRKN